MTKFIDKQGFNGSTVPRFTQYGVHPNAMEKGKTGIRSVDVELGPGKYDLSYTSCFDEKKLDKNSLKSDWRRALFLEQQGKIPHFMSKYLYKEKEEQKRRMGPGKYEYKSIFDYSNDKKYMTSLKSKSRRFVEAKKDSFPGPGTYGKFGIPDQKKYEADQKRKHCNTVGLLKRGGKSGRNFFHNINNIGPGIYQVKSVIDESLKHRTGLRNFYDCNSDEKLLPLKYGHRAILKPHDIGPGQYQHKEFINELNDRFHIFKGKFLQELQYPPKPHERVFYIDPANTPPDPRNQVCSHSYYPRNPNYRKCVSFGGKTYPFNFSSLRMDKIALANFTGNRTPFTGPGRYNIDKADASRHINAATAAFNSKTPQTSSEFQLKVIRERNRGRNLVRNDDDKIDHLATTKSACIQNITASKNAVKLH